MKASIRHVVLAAVMTIVLPGFGGAALAQDKEAVIKNREALMKGQGKDLGSVKAYIDGKGELAQAEAGAASLAQSTNKIPEVFPPGTGGTSTDGKYATKPAIWTDWNKFLDAQKNAHAKAEALLVAVKSGNKGTIEAAFGDMGKNGCGGCHETFREKLKD
jgi:cytochrome c556